MSGSHAAPPRRGARTVFFAEVSLALLAVTVPVAVLTTDSTAAAPPRAAWSANKFLGNKSTFDTGTGGWGTATSGTRVAVVATPAQSGTGSLALTNTATATANVGAVSGSSSSSWTPATAGSRWMGWASVRAGSTARGLNVTVSFRDASGHLLDQAQGQQVTDATGTWTALAPAVGIAPPNTAYAALRISMTGATPGETHYLDNAALESAPGGVARVVGPLHTSGNQIIDGNGHAIIFRGVNRVGLEGKGADDPTPDDIAHAQAWGANFVRVPLGEQFWMPSTCYYDPNYQSRVDAAVNTITGRGMVAMLNLHYNTITSCGPYGEQPMADAPNAITFWKQVAARYKGNPLVAFDLYNEPFQLTDEIWAHGGAVTWHNTTFQAAGMQQMLDAVRGTGATNLVFVTGNTWGNLWPKTAPLSGTNLVYALHAYTCPQSLPPACTNKSPYDPSQFFNAWLTPSKTYPVMVTEFGWPDPNDGTYIHNVIRYAETHGWGWAVFTWGDGTFGPFDLLANAGVGANYEPKPSGMPALAGFAGN